VPRPVGLSKTDSGGRAEGGRSGRVDDQDFRLGQASDTPVPADDSQQFFQDLRFTLILLELRVLEEVAEVDLHRLNRLPRESAAGNERVTPWDYFSATIVERPLLAPLLKTVFSA
jgi:hypothetical protein